jgi:D-alanyl-D-alanine carboxypeptidase
MRTHYLVLSILVLIAGHSCQPTNGPAAGVSNAMQAFIDESIAPGMGLAYYSKGTGTFFLAAGMADVGNNIPVKITTRYPIQSTTKMFMAILTLQLVDEGRLTLESTVDEWFNDLPNSDRVSIRHLLNHTSGFSNYQTNAKFMNTYFTDSLFEFTREDIIRAGLEISDEENYGTREYSNTNFLVLANIIEKIKGNSLSAELEHRIFRPAGMKHTYYKPDRDGDTTTIVKCYRFGEPIDLEKWNFLSNAGGGIVSTTGDMLRFAHWMIEGGYPEIMASEPEQIAYTFPDGFSGKYGLGIEIDDSLFGVNMLGHSGGNPGLIHEFRFSPVTGEILIYFLNEGRVGQPYGEFMKELEMILETYR